MAAATRGGSERVTRPPDDSSSLLAQVQDLRTRLVHSEEQCKERHRQWQAVQAELLTASAYVLLQA